MTNKPTKKRVKAGTSKASAADRRGMFVEAYLSNGGNATEAAISAGYSEASARRQGCRLTTDVHIRAILDKRRTELAAATELNTEKIIREVGRVAFSDIRRIMNSEGKILLPHELDDATAAAISSFKVSFDGSIEYKLWDKNSALERACKILGLFERDNGQKTDPLTELIRSLSGNVVGVVVQQDDEEEDDLAVFSPVRRLAAT